MTPEVSKRDERDGEGNLGVCGGGRDCRSNVILHDDYVRYIAPTDPNALNHESDETFRATVRETFPSGANANESVTGSVTGQGLVD